MTQYQPVSSSPWPLRDATGASLLMGIIDATPDSFSDGGAYDARDHALALLDQGADILDIGGESTRPGAVEIDAETEIARILPVIRFVHETRPDASISIDTYKAATARAALKAGARIVNDVWGLQRDPDMAGAVAEVRAGLVIMHNRHEKDDTLDIIDDIERFFERSLALAHRAGIPPDHIALDPGIGFGKSMPQNLAAIAGLPRLRKFGHRVLLGVSRKSILGHITGRKVGERLAATLAVNVYGALHGADILRVHDVAEHRDAVMVLNSLKIAGEHHTI